MKDLHKEFAEMIEKYAISDCSDKEENQRYIDMVSDWLICRSLDLI